MKKLTAVLVTVLLLVGLLAFGVSADGFVFREESRTLSGNTMTVTWNSAEAEGATIEDVLIGGSSYPFTPDGGTITLDLSTLPAGEYTVAYEYVAGATQKTASAATLVIEGEAAVKLSATIGDDGYVTITAKNELGMPIADYQLTLTIGTMSGLTGKTDANGTYKSYLAADPGATVVYEGLATAKGSVVYGAVAAASITRSAPTTTTTTTATTTTTEETTTTTEETTETSEETTTTTEETTTTATETEETEADATVTDAETVVTVAGAGTTSRQDDKLAINVSTDTAMLELFGCDFETFSEKARLLLSDDDYNGLIGRDNSNLLMLNLLTSTNPVTSAELRSALAGVSAFSAYGEDEREWITFDLSFLIMDREGNLVPVSAMPLNSTYIVQLPVPSSMKGCDKLAITLRDEEGFVTPMEVAVKDGTFKLEINSMEAYTLIGFKSESENRAGGVSVWVVLLYVLGVLLLAGAGAILYFFVFRAPDAKKNEESAEADADAPVIAVEPENDNDIFSGRTDIPSNDE